MKIVTLNGTFEINLERMKVLRVGDPTEATLRRVPSPVVGERMELETSLGSISTEPVTEVTP
jgi:hypothetical protein